MQQPPPGAYGPPPSQQHGPPSQPYGAPGYGPAGYPQQPQQQEKNGSATAALVLGVGSMLCWFTGVPALILGVVAHNQIKAQPNRYSNGSSATVGIVFGALSTLLLFGWGFIAALGAATPDTSSASNGSTTTATADKKPSGGSAPPAAAPEVEAPQYISESCYELSTKFGTSSKLSDLQKEELWKDYRGKSFEWSLEITEVSSGFLSGYTVQAKCAPRSPSLVQDIQLSYEDEAKSMVVKLEKGSAYKLRGKLTNTSTLFGLAADGAP